MKRLEDRHLYGAGAAACAVCCAPPLLALIGIAGTAATIATFAFAGLAFAAVIAGATLYAIWARSRRHADECSTSPASDPVALGPKPSAEER